MRTNTHGQPVGDPVPHWRPRPAVPAVTLVGRWCRLEPWSRPDHVEGLHRALDLDSDPSVFTYYPAGPFATATDLGDAYDAVAGARDTAMHVVLTPDGGPQGVASHLRADPANGVVEVGGIVLSTALQRTTAATEALYLLMRHAFADLGYRRYEWKCDSLNAPSRAAAGRLGFAYEGTFRNARVYRGRNRDTAWYAMTDAEWPAVRSALERWLDPSNFDEQGGQRSRLDVASALGGSPRRSPLDEPGGGSKA